MQAVARLLLEHGSEQRGRTHWEELPKATADLVHADPFALLLAMMLDYGKPWTVNWQIPFDLNRAGCLSAVLLDHYDNSECSALMNSIPTKHRWGTKRSGRAVHEAARLVVGAGGDASAVWRDRNVHEVTRDFLSIHGVGVGVAACAVRTLHDDFGEFQGQESAIDIKADVHTCRVFGRTGLVSLPPAEQAVVLAARALHPQFPGELDMPAWDLGRATCHESNPECPVCYLDEVCPKNGVLKGP